MKYIKTFENYVGDSLAEALMYIKPEDRPEPYDHTYDYMWTREEMNDLKAIGVDSIDQDPGWKKKPVSATFNKIDMDEDESKSKLAGDSAYVGMVIFKDVSKNEFKNTYTAVYMIENGKKSSDGKDYHIYWVPPGNVPLTSDDWEEFKKLLSVWLK